MADNGKRPKVVSIRSYSWLNIGTLLFGAIFIYMVIAIILYATAKHTTTYEVTSGTISGNYRYTALAAKTEKIKTSDYSGYVTYYARDRAKVAGGSSVCSIDESPAIAAQNAATVELTSTEYSKMRNTMSSFLLNFDNSNYQDVYSFKSDMETYILESGQSSESTSAYYANQVTTDETGFIVYTIDGMENLTDDDINSELFNRNNYSPENLRLSEKITAGDNLYKLVTGEEWSLYFQISRDLATQLQDRTSIRFRFLRDDTTFSSAFTVISNASGEYFGKITLANSLVRYVGDRFLEIELLMNQKEGLKIPSSAIAEESFYKIPSDYVITNSDSTKEITLLRETFDSDGSSKTEYKTATVYDKEDDYYVVSPSLFKEGDFVLMPDTTKRYEITDDDKLTIQGVYNINKGYAVFREVTVIDQNEEFCIVEPSNPYGLAAHDFIALDASSIAPDEILH